MAIKSTVTLKWTHTEPFHKHARGLSFKLVLVIVQKWEKHMLIGERSNKYVILLMSFKLFLLLSPHPSQWVLPLFPLRGRSFSTSGSWAGLCLALANEATDGTERRLEQYLLTEAGCPLLLLLDLCPHTKKPGLASLQGAWSLPLPS